MKTFITTIFTLFSFITLSATDDGSETPDSFINKCQYLVKATDDGSGNKSTNDNGTGKANDNGTGSKATNDSGAERYQAYLKCISQVKASDSGTG